jgi:cell fate (sporulation/competence/biofilm development) regulator YmcA (YheA/YmcA/DUF963 family)
MANRAEIKSAILRAAGNPSSGPIAEWADALADAVAELDAPKAHRKIEKRVVAPAEIRDDSDE